MSGFGIDEERLFQLSPIPTWSEDFSMVRTHLDQVGVLGRSESFVRAVLSERPDVLARCVQGIRIVRVNRACLSLHRASSAEELLAGLDRLVCEGSHAALVEQAVAVACGRTELDLDTMVKTLDGESRHVHLSWRVVPGCEQSLQRVIVCTQDITDRKAAEAALEARVRELTVLTAVGRTLVASQSADEVANGTVGGLVEHGVSDAAFFFVIEGEGLRCVAQADSPDCVGHRHGTLRFGECVCGEAFSDGVPRFVDDLAAAPACTRAECGAAAFRSFAALPISVDGRVLGVLGLASRRPVEFAEQRAFFDALVRTIGFGLHNARLVEGLRHRGEELEREMAARRLAERQLRDEVTLSESMIRSLPAVFYLFDRRGRFLRWNVPFEEATGRSSAEIAETHPLDLFTGADRETIAARIAEVFVKGEASTEAMLVAKDGTQRPYFFSGRRTEMAGTECLIGVGLDLSALAEAQRSFLHLSGAIEASGDVVFVTDSSGVFASVNPRFTEVYGYERAEVVGRVTPRILKSGRQEHAVYEAFWRRIKAGELFRGEVVNRAKDGREVVVDETVSPFFDHRGAVRGFLAIQRDVTERRRLETERARLRDRLLQSQKLEALGRLAGGVAHDFNNLLTVIRCYSRMVADSLDESDGRRGDLEDVVAAGDRAAGLTAQLLAFSRRQVLEPRVVSLNAVVAGMDGLVRRLVGAQIEVTTRLAASPDSVLADEGQLGQVLLNLVVNARDAMPAGGRVELTTNNGAYAGSPGAAPVVCLRVRDTGHGMDAETIAHVFEPFFTTKERGRGTGLGLATVYGIVTQSGGEVRASSEPGDGSVFEVTLPLATGTTSSRPHEHVAETASAGEIILLVEDDDAVRATLERVLRRLGYRVLTAANGAQALALVSHGALSPSLVLTDVVMPHTGGVELSQQLAARHPDLPVILMSGHIDSPDGPGDLHAIGDRFIAKPIAEKELAAILRRALGQGRTR